MLKVSTISATKSGLSFISVHQSSWVDQFWIKNAELPIKSSPVLLVIKWCFDTPKAESLSYVANPQQKEKININRPCSYQAWYYHTSFIYLQALVIAMSPIFSLPKINESRLLEKLESKCSNVSKTSSVIEINLRKQYFVVLLWQIYFPTMVLQAIFWKFQENIFALKASAV